MLEVTEAAREYLLDRLNDSGDDTSCFRIVESAEQTFALESGAREPADVVVEHSGQTILAVEPGLVDTLQGWVLDVEGLPGEDQQLLMIPAQDFPSG
jgi:hypothetical protein